MSAPVLEESVITPNAVERPPHRWFPGYTVAAVSTLAMLATAPGQTMIVSLFNAPLRAMLGLDDASAGQLNVAYTIATVAAGLPLVLIGRLTDKLGPRKTMVLIAALFALGCVVMAGAFNLATVFLGFFLLRFLGQGALSLVAQHAVAMWFHRRLGSINGVKMVVLFGLWVPAPLVAAWMITQFGWRWSYVVFAAGIALTVIPTALLFLRDTPEELGLRMDNDPPRRKRGSRSGRPASIARAESDEKFQERYGEERPSPTGAGPHPIDRDDDSDDTTTPEPSFTLKQATRTRAYWTIAAAFFLSPLIGTALLFDMQPILIGLGVDLAAHPKQGALPASAWLATVALMSLPAGVMTDRLRSGPLMLAGMLAILLSPLVFVLVWLGPDRFALWGAVVGMVAFGVGQTIVGACGSAAVARYYGRSHHGAIRSSLTRIGVIGTGLGPVFTAGTVFVAARLDAPIATGHAWAMLIFIAMCVPVGIAVIGLRKPALLGVSG